MAGCLSIATVGGGFWLWGYVRSQIVPLIQVEVEQALDRPVALGEIERVSLTGFRLGKSAIPATSTDSDQVNIGAIEIGFNPLDALTTRQVDLTVTLRPVDRRLGKQPPARQSTECQNPNSQKVCRR